MLKIKIEDNTTDVIEAEGDVVTTCSELLLATSIIYNAYRESNSLDAGLFKSLMQAAIARPDSIVWDEHETEGSIIRIPRIRKIVKESDDTDSERGDFE